MPARSRGAVPNGAASEPPMTNSRRRMTASDIGRKASNAEPALLAPLPLHHWLIAASHSSTQALRWAATSPEGMIRLLPGSGGKAEGSPPLVAAAGYIQ